MTIKRVISEEKLKNLKKINLKEFKGKDPSKLTQEEINSLVKKMAMSQGIL